MMSIYYTIKIGKIFFISLCSSNLAFGQNQHPPLSDNSYPGLSRPYSLHFSIAIFSENPYFSSSDMLFSCLCRLVSLLCSSGHIPIYWMTCSSKVFRKSFIAFILQSRFIPHVPVCGNPKRNPLCSLCFVGFWIIWLKKLK